MGLSSEHLHANIELINLELAPKANKSAAAARHYHDHYLQHKKWNDNFDRYWEEANVSTHAIGFMLSLFCSFILGLDMYASVLGDIFFSGSTEAPWYWALIISALISVMALLVSYFGVRGYNDTYKSWKIFSDTENGTSIDVSTYQFGQKQPKWKMYCLVLSTILLLTTILFAFQRYKWQGDATGHYEIVNLVMMLLAVLSIAMECFTGDLALMWLKRHRNERKMVKYYRMFRYHLCETAELDKRISMLASQLPNEANRLLLGDARKCIYRAENFSTDLDNYLDPFQ